MRQHPIIWFWITLVVLFFAVLYCDRKYCMLKDTSTARPQPYSWSRVQLAWWSLIVLSSFIATIVKYGVAPTLNESTVILIGISAATIATARAIDISDEANPNIVRHQNIKGKNLFIDIISDDSGPSIHRFQTLVFNIVFGAYFIGYVLDNLASGLPCAIYADKAVLASDLVKCTTNPQDYIMPFIATNNLILLGLSSATYAAMKLTENKEETIVKKRKGTAVDTISDVDNTDMETTTNEVPVDEPAVG